MSLSEINLTFKRCKKEKRPARLSYIVAGDPNKRKSLKILKSISENVDICEIGYPHSTPIGDGGKITNGKILISLFLMFLEIR